MAMKFVVCLQKQSLGDFSAEDITLGKHYEVVEEDAGKGMTRIIDESGEDYLYPAAWFGPAPSEATSPRAIHVEASSHKKESANPKRAGRIYKLTPPTKSKNALKQHKNPLRGKSVKATYTYEEKLKRFETTKTRNFINSSRLEGIEIAESGLSLDDLVKKYKALGKSPNA